jgi:hypothetical protein
MSEPHVIVLPWFKRENRMRFAADIASTTWDDACGYTGDHSDGEAETAVAAYLRLITDGKRRVGHRDLARLPIITAATGAPYVLRYALDAAYAYHNRRWEGFDRYVNSTVFEAVPFLGRERAVEIEGRWRLLDVMGDNPPADIEAAFKAAWMINQQAFAVRMARTARRLATRGAHGA